MSKIRVNQIGYRVNDAKRAVFADLEGDTFKVISADGDKCAFDGKLSAEVKNDAAGEMNKVADFSDLKTPGRYYIQAENGEKSYEFEIGDDIYGEALKASLKMFYMQRCGCELPKEYAGIWSHPSCHDTPARIYGTDEFKDVNGGWHDAGDYGRYVVPAAKAVVDLLMAYEAFPEAASVKFDIPGDDMGLPDILAEAKYEIDWMLKMQREDGAVYNKVTCASFPDFVMPQLEREELIICPVGDTATADFIAAMCWVYRIYRRFDGAKAFADKCFSAAKKSFEYLRNHRDGEFKNPEGIVTGEYGDSDTRDEIFWAYAEMFKTTGDKSIETELESLYSDDMHGLFEWADVGFYGFLAYITSDYSNKALYEKLYRRLTDYATGIVESVKNDPYGYTMNHRYYWGCLMGVANDAMLLIILDRLSGKNEFADIISVIVTHIFGNNANDICYLTGFGTNSPKHPHHRPSGATGQAVPGLLVGGVEPKLLDDYMAANYKGVPAAKCYADRTESYSTNEITIYWNSPLVFVLAALMQA